MLLYIYHSKYHVSLTKITGELPYPDYILYVIVMYRIKVKGYKQRIIFPNQAVIEGSD